MRPHILWCVCVCVLEYFQIYRQHMHQIFFSFNGPLELDCRWWWWWWSAADLIISEEFFFIFHLPTTLWLVIGLSTQSTIQKKKKVFFWWIINKLVFFCFWWFKISVIIIIMMMMMVITIMASLWWSSWSWSILMMNDRCIGQYIIMIIGLFQESGERKKDEKNRNLSIYLWFYCFWKKTQNKKRNKIFLHPL